MSLGLTRLIDQMALSRDKCLNQKAQQKALVQEHHRLHCLGQQLLSSLSNDIPLLHEQDVDQLNRHIEQLFEEKCQLVQQYIQMAQIEAAAVLQGDMTPNRKQACDTLRTQIECELRFFSGQLQTMQQERAAVLSDASLLQKQWLQSENERLNTLNQLFRRHATILEKIYVRHAHHSEMDGVVSCPTYRYLTGFSAQWLMQFYGTAQNITIEQSEQEHELRRIIRSMSSAANENYD